MDELETYKSIVIVNLVQVTQQILQHAKKVQEPEIDLNSIWSQKIFGITNPFETQLTTDISESLVQIWKLRRVHELVDVAVKEDLKPSANYFKDHLQRVLASDYMPIERDVLMVRQRTAGINSVEIEVPEGDPKSDNNNNNNNGSGGGGGGGGGKRKINVVDGGGQAAERRKWTAYIDENNTVLYCLGLDEYDIPSLDRENKITTLEFSLELLENTLLYCKQQNKPVIVFLNKIDLFADKLKKVPFQNYYKDFTGGIESQKAKEFFETRINAIAKKNNIESMYTYFTCALEKDLVKKVFDSVKDHLINSLINSNFGFD